MVGRQIQFARRIDGNTVSDCVGSGQRAVLKHGGILGSNEAVAADPHVVGIAVQSAWLIVDDRAVVDQVVAVGAIVGGAAIHNKCTGAEFRFIPRRIRENAIDRQGGAGIDADRFGQARTGAAGDERAGLQQQARHQGVIAADVIESAGPARNDCEGGNIGTLSVAYHCWNGGVGAVTVLVDVFVGNRDAAVRGARQFQLCRAVDRGARCGRGEQAKAQGVIGRGSQDAFADGRQAGVSMDGLLTYMRLATLTLFWPLPMPP